MREISANELATVLSYLSQCVLFTEKILKQPDCTTCGKLKTCEYRPNYDDDVCINCPLWIKEVKGDEK